MKISLRIIGVLISTALLTIFLTACGSGGGGGSDGGDTGETSGTTYKMAEYFPLGQGDTWTYDNNGETHLISGTVLINGVNATIMIIDVSSEYLLFDISNGAIRIHKIYDSNGMACGGSQTEFTPGAIMLPAELSIGGKHTTSTTANYSNCVPSTDTQTVTLEGTLEAVEDVTVPAGTFKNCLRYRMLISNLFDDKGRITNSDETWWIAKGIGIVKSIENGRTEQLINATVGGVVYP